jgi:cell wall-associated NlpC family hydrolase
VGEDVPSVEETKTGDLLFFHHASGKIIHVALVVKSGVALHASGSVRYDRFDSTGLYHTTTGKRTHNLHSIKRIDRHVL